ncbi:hypothetical protein A3Q56_03211 [Intoshia linei]|uniref:Uncharacterized protein n=1 Tax=Intoshia linei TaxID=1819745 RepID=A0A177B401_9BILA|nr:hypothetical protein A3Q56_03211 [Intoshia linei]
MRIPFLQLLSEKWWSNKQRPQKLDGNFPFIGLAVDSTSLKMFRPHEVELNAKKMYDSVMTTPPHYALFSQDAFLGSEHDYSAFKRNFKSYLGYLKKLPIEETDEKSDTRWGMILDSGYMGPDSDTLGLRKYVMNRPPLIKPVDVESQKELTSIRGCVEKFYLVYFLKPIVDISHFNVDFDICVLLTNEIISRTQLTDNDIIYDLGLISLQKRQNNSRTLKSREEYVRYKMRKQYRISGDFSISSCSSSPFHYDGKIFIKFKF